MRLCHVVWGQWRPGISFERLKNTRDLLNLIVQLHRFNGAMNRIHKSREIMTRRRIWTSCSSADYLCTILSHMKIVSRVKHMCKRMSNINKLTNQRQLECVAVTNYREKDLQSGVAREDEQGTSLKDIQMNGSMTRLYDCGWPRHQMSVPKRWGLNRRIRERNDLRHGAFLLSSLFQRLSECEPNCAISHYSCVKEIC